LSIGQGKVARPSAAACAWMPAPLDREAGTSTAVLRSRFRTAASIAKLPTEPLVAVLRTPFHFLFGEVAASAGGGGERSPRAQAPVEGDAGGTPSVAAGGSLPCAALAIFPIGFRFVDFRIWISLSFRF
jgi:hypothetical protein